MIVENEEGIDEKEFPLRYDIAPMSNVDSTPEVFSREPTTDFNAFVQRIKKVRDSDAHTNLKENLVKHVYSFHGKQKLTDE